MRLIDRGLEAILIEGGKGVGLSLAAGLAGVAALGVVVPELVEKLRTLPIFSAETNGLANRLQYPELTRDRAGQRVELSLRLYAAGIRGDWPSTDAELAVAADALMEANDPLGECLAIRLDGNTPYLITQRSWDVGDGDEHIGIKLEYANDTTLVLVQSPRDYRDSVLEAFGGGGTIDTAEPQRPTTAYFYGKEFADHVDSLRRDKR